MENEKGWECVFKNQSGLMRLEVPGGWIYKYDGLAGNLGLVFVPQPVVRIPDSVLPLDKE